MRTESHTRLLPRVAYEVHGKRGSPVLFIMGLGMRGLIWSRQVDALRTHFLCCTYDHLGVGHSDPAPRSVTTRSMADDAIRVIDDLGWNRVHIVGVSLGGMIAQELALRHESRCRSLALIATHGGGPLAGFPTLEGVRHFLGAVARRGEARARALEHLLYPGHFRESLDPEQRRLSTASRMENLPPLRTVLKQIRAARRHRAESRLSELALPTLLVRPGMDILIRPSQMDRLARRLRHAQVLRFDDSGHGVLFQKASELNSALRTHFERADAATP